MTDQAHWVFVIEDDSQPLTTVFTWTEVADELRRRGFPKLANWCDTYPPDPEYPYVDFEGERGLHVEGPVDPQYVDDSGYSVDKAKAKADGYDWS